MSLEEFTAAEKEYIQALQPSVGLLQSSTVPSQDELDNLYSSAYILTETGLYYFNTSALQPVALPPSKLAQLRTNFSSEGQIKQLSDEKLRVITSISGHTPPSYQDMSSRTNERWHTILNRFRALAPECEAELALFQKQRIDANGSIFNLSLDSCLDYFENFYFLYTTTDARFALNDYTKKRLLESIKDAMATCETGKSTRFEIVLQLYRTDLNWITNLLSKQRYELILAMNDAYNNEHHTAAGMQPHVLKIMTQLAADANLGIKIEHYVRDVYAGYMSQASISAYFKANYPRVFLQEYEDAIVETLSQHLLFEMNEMYNATATWETTGITIVADDVGTLDDFLNKRLGLTGVNVQGQLGSFNDEYTAYQLKTKPECLAALRGLVKQKLLNEEYGVALNLVTKDNKDAFKKMALNVKKGASIDAICSLNKSFSKGNTINSHQLAHVIAKYADTLLLYPELLLNAIETHPEWLLLLPTTLKNNTFFVEAMVAKLAPQLLTAFEENHEDKIVQLTTILFKITKYNADYLHHLPVALLSHPPFALQLVKKDGLLLKILPDQVKNNADIVNAALQQNYLVFKDVPKELSSKKEYSEIFKEFQKTELDLQLHEFVSNLGCYRKGFFMPIHHADAIVKLSTTKHLSTKTVVRLAQMVSPEELIKIVNFRKKQGLPALPYCSNTSIINDFTRSLREQKIEDWRDDGYYSVKKRASEMARVSIGNDAFSTHCATNYLAKTDSWFIAMLQYQRANFGAYTGLRQFWEQLKQVILTIGRLLWSTIKLAAISVITIPLVYYTNLLIAATLAALPASLPLALLVFALLGPAITRNINNRILNSVTALLSSLIISFLVFDLFIAIYAIKQAGGEIYNVVKQLMATVTSTITLFSRLFKSMLPDSELKHAVGEHANIRTKCEESISRLRMIETPSAQDKADILETVFDKINGEIDIALASHQIDPTDVEKEMAHQLTEPQTFSFREQQHHLSFYQVANLPRSNGDFTIPDKAPAPSRFAFFNAATLKLLPKVQELETLACAYNM